MQPSACVLFGPDSLENRRRVGWNAAGSSPPSQMLAGLLSIFAVTATGAASLPELFAIRTSDAPTVDGRLDDMAWRGVQGASAFTQKYPKERASPTESTRLMAVYDDRALYLAIACDQTTVPIIANLTRRDRLIESDKVTIDID